MCVFLGHNVNLMLPRWDGEQLSYVINDQLVKNSGVSIYRWTPQSRKLGCPDTVDTNGLTPMLLSIFDIYNGNSFSRSREHFLTPL